MHQVAGESVDGARDMPVRLVSHDIPVGISSAILMLAGPAILAVSAAPAVGPSGKERSVGQILWIVFVVIVAIWLIGLVADVAGNLIHLLLVVALIVLVYNLITGRRQL